MASVSPKTRFEVFKRDGFTCQYCGRKTPQVVLEADHIIPRAEDGGDEPENLVTSCWECNRGKGAGMLDDRAPVPEMHDQTVVILERELQLREYNEVKRQQRAREDAEIAELLTYWTSLGRGFTKCWPDEPGLRWALRGVPMEDIKDAMEIAVTRKNAGQSGVHYLMGILRNWINGGAH